MLLTDMMKCADKAALEDAEKALYGIRGDIAASVFIHEMINLFMRDKFLSDLVIYMRFIRHQACFLRNMLAQDRCYVLGIDTGNMKAAHVSVALDKRYDLHLVYLVTLAAKFFRTFGFTPIGFVHFYGLATGAKQPAAIRFHSLADTVRHEPCRFIGNAKHSVKLVAAHAFLAGCHQVKGAYPLVKRYMAAFKQCADSYRKGFLAGQAVVKAFLMILTFNRAAFLNLSAM